MPDTVFNFKSSGEKQIIDNLAKLQKQFQDSTKGVLELSQALGKNFSAANEFAKSIGLSGDKAAAAVKQLQALNAAGATTQDRYEALNKGLGITAQQFSALDKAVGDYNKEQAATAKATQSTADSLARLQKNSQASADGILKLGQALGKSFGAAREFAESIGLSGDKAASAVKQLQTLNSAGATTQDRFNVLNRGLGITAQQFLALDKAVSEYNKEQARLAAIAQQVKTAEQAQAAELKKLAKEQRDANVAAKEGVSAFSSFLQGIGQGVGQAALQAFQDGLRFIVDGLRDFVVSSVEAARRLTDFTNTLTIVTGSSASAAAELAKVRAIVDELSLPLEASIEGFTKLSAAAAGTSFEGAGVEKIFRGVSDAASALGLSSDKVNGAFLALEQIISKGSVQAEELRGQLGERIPGAFNIFADSLGVTTAELNDLLKAGQVGSDALIGFAEELTRRFGGQSLDSPTKALNRLQTSIFDIQSQLGTAIQPAFTASLDAISATLQKTTEQTGAFDIIGAAAQRFADTLKENPQIIDDIAEGLADIANLLAANIADAIDFISNGIKENPNLVREFVVELEKGVTQLLVVADTVIKIVQLFTSLGTLSRQLIEDFTTLGLLGKAFNFLAGIGEDVRGASTGLGSLEEKIRNLDAAAQGVGDTFGGLSSGVTEAANKQIEEVLNASDAFEAANEAIATSQTAAAAELAKAYADGLISQEEFNRQTLFNDDFAFERRINRLRARRDELRAAISPEELREGTTDNAKAVRQQLSELNAQIAEEDLKFQQQRIKNQEDAQKEIEERQKEALEKLKEAYEDADRAIEESTQTRILNVDRLEAEGALSAEDAALERVRIEEQANQQQIANVEAREAEINAKIQAGTISREDGEKELDELNEELSQLRLERIQNEIDAIEAQKAIAIAAINERRDAAESALNAESTLNDIAVSGIQSQLTLLEARNGILAATAELEQSRIERALKLAEEEGRTNEAVTLRSSLFASQRREQDRQIAQKRQELKLQQELLATQNESKQITAEIAILEAQTAVEIARVNGATDEQIARLERVLELRQLQLGAVQESGKAEEAALQLKEQQLDAEARLTRERQQQAEDEARREAEKNARGSSGGGSGEGIVFSGASLEALNKASESLRRINESLDQNAQAIREIQLSGFDPVLIQQLLEAGFEEPVARAFEQGGARAADAVKQQLETIGFENAGGSFSQSLTVDVTDTLERFGVQVESVTEGLASLDRAGQDAELSLSSLSGARFPGRKTGGDVKGGKAVVVGEAGPELYVPGNDGWIINHTWTKRLLSEEKRYSLPAGGVIAPVNAQMDVKAITGELRVLQQQNRELVKALGSSGGSSAMQMTNYWNQAAPPTNEILDLARKFLPRF